VDAFGVFGVLLCGLGELTDDPAKRMERGFIVFIHIDKGG